MPKVHATTPVMPHMVVSNAKKAIEFYQEAFGAKELFRADAEDGKRLMHAAIELNGGGVVMLNDDFPEFGSGGKSTPEALKGTPVTIHLEQKRAKDVDVLFLRATKAGAKTIMKPDDMFWGDRYAVVEDPFGHRWSIAAPTDAK